MASRQLFAFVQRTSGKPYVYGLSLDPGKVKQWFTLEEEECLIEKHAEIEAAIPNKDKFTKDRQFRTVTVSLKDQKICDKYLNDANQLFFNDRVLLPESTTSEYSISQVLSSSMITNFDGKFILKMAFIHSFLIHRKRFFETFESLIEFSPPNSRERRAIVESTEPQKTVEWPAT